MMMMMINLCICQVTGCAVAPALFNGDRPSQWEMANFDPLQNHNPQADCHKMLHN